MDFNSPRQIWDAVLGELQLQVSQSNYRTWFEKTVGLDSSGHQFVIGVPNTFVAEYLGKNQRSLIEKTIIGVLHHPVEVVFRVAGGDRNALVAPRTFSTPALNSNYTFGSFIVGNHNRLAYTAALEVANLPGCTYNPLFICGAHGLGKTHLLQAIGHQASSKHMRVIYTSGEQYTNEFISAIKERHTEEFRNKYRNAEMLLIDDLDFITGKEQTEESLFHTINELENANHQIAVTSDYTIQTMPQISEKLRSRLQGGLVADIQAPDYNTRLAILEAKATQKGVALTPDTLEIIAQNVKQNIRELEGSLNRVIAYARLVHDKITPELAACALENIGRQNTSPAGLTPQLLVEAVAETFRLSPAELRGQKRDKETALARQVAMFIMKQEMSCSLAQIGRELGGRNPATITHGCQKIASDLDGSPYLQEKITEIKGKIGSLSGSSQK